MNDIKVRIGGQFNIQVTQGDKSSISATLVLKHKEEPSYIEITEDFVDGVANLNVPGDLLVLGVYNYQVNENFTDGDPIKYPDPNDCKDCEFPTITVCEALDVQESS